jgi:tRNA (guanosine-2'-O-)-methyltransferase
MSPRRPPRAWIGTPLPADPTELLGPRGLTQELLDEELSVLGGPADPPESDLIATPRPPDNDAVTFYWSLLTPERQARIERVVASRLRSVTVVMDRLIDAHNTAAIFRTAEGLGLAAAHVVQHENDDGGAHPRVTQDAHKWLDVQRHASGAQAAQALHGFEVWAGHLDEKARPYDELPDDRPIALLFGNEHEGPSAETLRVCAGTFCIPMAGFTQSFNVSVAAGIALTRACERRRAYLRSDGDLDEAERAALKARFTLLAAKLARRLKRPRR